MNRGILWVLRNRRDEQRREVGATVVEYALIAAFAVLAIWGGVEALGVAVDGFLESQCVPASEVTDWNDPPACVS